MTRMVPEVRALYERVRRPAKMLGLGLALMIPAGAMVVSQENAVEREAQARLESEVKQAKAVDGPIASAWQEKALERERVKVAEVFAQEFGISPSLAKSIHTAAEAEQVDPKVAFGLVRAESSFRRSVVSSAGAVGYTQLLPSTARWIAPGTSRSELFDTDTNLRVGFKYLRKLMDQYDGDVRLALTAYNRGPGTVARELKRGRNPENGYADMVLEGKNAHTSGHLRKMKVKPGRARS